MIYMYKMATICVIIMKFPWIYLSSVTDFQQQPTLYNGHEPNKV